MTRLKKKYQDDVIPAMIKEFGYKNVHQVPRLEKIALNVGMGEALQNKKLLDAAVGELRAISGQKPVVTRARKDISNFKLREGVPIGVRVTLRGNQMYEFFERFVGFALPRVRDFKGLSSKSFDGRGNYTVGIREQLIFPEIDYDTIEKIKGMNVTICTTAETDEAGRVLLKTMGFPFRN